MGMKNVSLYDIPLDLFLKYYSKNASLNSKLEGYRELQNNSFKNPELFFEVPDKTLSLVKKTPNDLWLGYRDGDIITKTQLKNAYGECFKYINDDGEEAIRFNFSSDVIREEFMNTPGKYIYHILEESSRKVKIDTAEGNITIPVSLKKLSIRVSIDGQPEYIITPSIINKEIQLIIAIPTSSEEKSFRFKIDFLNNNKTVGSDTYVFKNPAKDSIGNIKKRFPEDTRFQQSGFIMYKLSIPVNYENELQEYIVYLENFESIALSPSAKRNNDLYITKPEINKFTILGVERVPSNIGAIPSTLTLQKVIPYPVSSTLTIPENLEGKYELYDVFNAFYNIDALYQSYRGTSEDAIVGTDLDSNSVSYRKQQLKNILNDDYNDIFKRGKYLYQQSVLTNKSRSLLSMYDYSKDIEKTILNTLNTISEKNIKVIPLKNISEINSKLIIEKKTTEISTISESVPSTVQDNRDIYEKLQQAEKFPIDQDYLNYLKLLAIANNLSSADYSNETEFRTNIYFDDNGNLQIGKRRIQTFNDTEMFNILKLVVENNINDVLEYTAKNSEEISNIIPDTQSKILIEKIRELKNTNSTANVSEKFSYGNLSNLENAKEKLSTGDWSVIE